MNLIKNYEQNRAAIKESWYGEPEKVLGRPQGASDEEVRQAYAEVDSDDD